LNSPPKPHAFVSLPLQSTLPPGANFIKAIFYKEKIVKPSVSREEQINKFKVLFAD
jgi:hypothetical protein